MRVISAEDAANTLCLLAEGTRQSVTSARDMDAWRAQYSQRLSGTANRTPAVGLDCDSPQPDVSQAVGLDCDPAPGGVRSMNVWLELVESCNLDCAFCYNPWRPPESSLSDRPLLSLEHLQRSLERIFAHLPINHVTLSGGEPLLYPQINTLTRYVRQHCESIAMTSNGRSLTRRRLSALKNAGLSHINVPLHSNSAAVHDELAGGRSWRAAVRALALSVESGLTTNLSCVVTWKNAEHVGAVAEMALALGIKTIILNCFHATGQGADKKDLKVSDAEFMALVESLRTNLEGQAEVVVGTPPPLAAEERRKKINRITISPFGDLKLCGHSSAGLVNVDTEPDEFDAFLNAISRNDYDDYLQRIDSCTCH
jgi:MoaA/NifB/PqqE/SkfB family radical SAM enzyme